MRTTPPESPARRAWAGLAVLAAVVVPAVVLVRPGQVVDDGRTALLVDPTAALVRGLRIWDPDRALGTVAAGDVRRLWPLGAYHWLMEAARVPDWVAQRLWLAGLLLAAAGGVLAISRAWRWRPAAALAAAVAYGLSPVVATGTLDAGALLPWAGLPWLVHLVIQALRHRGWRHPVAFAVVLAAVGSGDATDAVLLLAVPLAWVAHARWISRETSRARAITTVAKLGVVVVALNAWWIVALSVQSTNGVDAARFGLPPDVTASTSSALEVVRGLGQWQAYESGATARYTQQPMLLLASLLVPVLGVIALGVSRWRYRAFAIGLAVAGTVLAAAAFDAAPASPVRAVLELVGETRGGLALRGLDGAVVVVVLALSLGVGALVAAAGEQSVRRGALGALAVAVVAAGALPTLWLGDVVPAGAARDQLLTSDTVRLADHLDAGDDSSRVLELPGRVGPTDASSSPLAAALDRPHVIREHRPSGSAAGTDLLRAIDDRVQDGTLAPAALAPLARLLGVGDVVVRAGEAPGATALLGVAPGLGPVEAFGDLLTAAVEGGVDVVRTHDDARIVLLSGSGDGIVDAAAAGLLRGDELIRYSSSVTDDPDFVRSQLVDQRSLVVTDTNRVRAERWTGVQGVHGFTEAPDGGVLAEDPFDQRLEVQPDRDGTRTVADQGALTARATSYGPVDRYRPDQRPSLAIDGEPETAWVVPAARSEGQELEVTAADPVEAAVVRIVQRPGADGTAIGQVVVRLDGEDPTTVALTEASRQAPGQQVDLGGRPFRTLTLEVGSLTGPAGADAEVGIAEVDLDGLRGSGWVRMPSDLLDAAGFRSTRYPLALVQTRLRGGDGADDEERSLRRIVELATTRTYRLSGNARAVSGSEPGGECREDLVAVDGGPVAVRLLPAPGRGALRIEGCDPAGITVPGGERRFSTAPGADTGIDVDQLLWSSDPVGVSVPDDAGSAPALRVTAREATALSLDVDGATRGGSFWIVLSQSHDPGWQSIEADSGTPAEVDGPHLVNGYANGFLVTPRGRDVQVDLRFVPQNRVEVALLFSGLALALALALALPRPQPLGVAPSHRQEPFRRLRAFTYEGALPTKREAITVALIGAGVGTLVAGPAVGIVLAAVGGFATRREGWRPAFTLLPGLLLAGTAVAVVLAQIEDRAPHSRDWPAQWGWAHVTTLTALLLLGLDVVIDHIWRRGSLLE